MWEKNFYIGANELIIVFKLSMLKYYVLEEYENYEKVFSGSYLECLEYCEERLIRYLENTIG